MGEVEQMRMATPLGETVDTTAFSPNPAVEAALVRGVQTAQRNLDAYRTRVAAFLETEPHS